MSSTRRVACPPCPWRWAACVRWWGRRAPLLTLLLSTTAQGEAKLRELVSTLDLRKEEAIERTFKQVARSFREIFAELCPGGSGQLVMVKRGEGQGEEGEEEGHPRDEVLDRYSGVKARACVAGCCWVAALDPAVCWAPASVSPPLSHPPLGPSSPAAGQGLFRRRGAAHHQAAVGRAEDPRGPGAHLRHPEARHREEGPAPPARPGIDSQAPSIR